MMGRISGCAALQRAAACALALEVLACGSSSDEGSSLFQPLEPVGTVRDVAPDPPAMPGSSTSMPVVEQPSTAEPGAGAATGMEPMAMAPAQMSPAEVPSGGADNPSESVRQPGACQPALGVSGAPETIPQALILINTLPKPTTLECFLQALDRPLNVYFTSSDLSLQPAPDERTPRTFIQRGNLYMSIVFGGAAAHTLEFGYRPVPNRSIKAEIEFPITRDLSEDTLFDRIAQTETTSVCGNCHISEALETFPEFPRGAYASDIFEPYELLEVPLEVMQGEAASCAEGATDERCILLSALFDNGPLLQGELLPGERL